MMGVKVASMRLKSNWADDEWPDMLRVSHEYTPGNVRVYVDVVMCRDCAEWPEGEDTWYCSTADAPMTRDCYCMWGERR